MPWSVYRMSCCYNYDCGCWWLCHIADWLGVIIYECICNNIGLCCSKHSVSHYVFDRKQTYFYFTQHHNCIDILTFILVYSKAIWHFNKHFITTGIIPTERLIKAYSIALLNSWIWSVIRCWLIFYCSSSNSRVIYNTNHRFVLIVILY